MAKQKTPNDAANLVIVESPAKAKTIRHYLGPGFSVLASMGHVRDLPSRSLSVDVNDEFKPTYEIIPARRKTVASLKKAADQASTVFLATDLDREGEAIAWHLAQALDIDANRTRRVVFNAITKSAIQQAFAQPHALDMDKVNAQQARRILDRIVGYEISPLLWRKVARGLSAGRVQSVAVRLIVDREREILAFKPEEYWRITGLFATADRPDLAQQWQAFLASSGENAPAAADKLRWLTERQCLEACLSTFAGQPFRPNNQADTGRVLEALQNASFAVAGVQTKPAQSFPPAPFITSTLQQQAANRLRFSAAATMRLAQQLYEGVEIKGLGSVGLITYMRTDSTHIAPEALAEVRRYIQDSYGPDYVPDKPRQYGSSNKAAQEAHEAIRPTDVRLSPDRVRADLDDRLFRLYELIWARFVGCQMNPARWLVTTLTVSADTPLGQAVFKTSGRKLLFDGFMKVAGVSTDDQILPALQAGQPVWALHLQPSQHFTIPPPRYGEASLVKTLEAKGIGRPSTYAAIISTIQERGYVEQTDRKFQPTDLGMVVTDKLTEHFPRIMDVAFTSHMEEQLDEIEEGQCDWAEVLRDFYGPFKETLDLAHENMQHAKAEVQPSEYACPKCHSPLVYRFGKNGRFLSCSTYPTCNFACPCDRQGKMVQPEPTEFKCPQCGKEMFLRRGRFGSFLGCSAYPDCKTIVRLDKQGQPLPPKPPAAPCGVRCYKCEGELVIRQSKRGPFLGCGRFPKCRTIISMKQLDLLRKLQQEGAWPPATLEQADELLGRHKKTAAAIPAGRPRRKPPAA